MSKSGGVFQTDDVTRTMSKGGGGAPGVPPIQVQTPPPPGWLHGYGPGTYNIPLTNFSGMILNTCMYLSKGPSVIDNRKIRS